MGVTWTHVATKPDGTQVWAYVDDATGKLYDMDQPGPMGTGRAGYTLGDYMTKYSDRIGTYADQSSTAQGEAMAGKQIDPKLQAKADKLMADKLKADAVVNTVAADLSNLKPEKSKKTSKWGWWNR